MFKFENPEIPVILPGAGPYVESVFFHKKTKTLLVTDLVVFVPPTPLDVIPPKNLIDLARNDGLNAIVAGDLSPQEVKAKTTKGPVPDTPKNRQIGRSLFCLVSPRQFEQDGQEVFCWCCTSSPSVCWSQMPPLMRSSSDG